MSLILTTLEIPSVNSSGQVLSGRIYFFVLLFHILKIKMSKLHIQSGLYFFAVTKIWETTTTIHFNVEPSR